MKLGKSVAVQQKLRLERQRVYMRSLQETIPDTETQLRGVLRDSATPSPRLADQEQILALPPGWLSGASAALTHSLDGIVPRSLVRDSDWFLSSLLHPSFIRPSPSHKAQQRDLMRGLRQRYAMPQELLLCGAANLRLVRESIASASALARRAPPTPHSTSMDEHPSLTPLPLAPSDQELAHFPQLFGREQWILFANGSGQGASQDRVPVDVLVTAETALCGAIALTCGPETLFAYMDHCRAAAATAASAAASTR